MFKKAFVVLIVILFISSISFAQELNSSHEYYRGNYDDDFGQRLGFTALCSLVGAAGGALVWYIKFSKEYSDNIDNNIDAYLNEYKNYDSIDAWLESRQKEKEKAKKEVVEWVIGGAVVGALFGVVLYPESSRGSFLNLSSGEKPQIRFPKVKYSIHRHGITVPLVEYKFR